MNTFVTYINRFFFVYTILLAHNISVYSTHAARSANDLTSQDTTFLDYSGLILDNITKKPVALAGILISGTNTGTVANTEGEFIIKVPLYYQDKQLQILALGYRTLFIPFKTLNKSGNDIFLEPLAYPLEEVEIHKIDAVSLLREVLKKIPENYSTHPNMLTAFYRETIKQNRNYAAVSEAVFEVYKAGYGKLFDTDRIKIYKGRKSQDVSRMDTILFKLQGGPYYIFQLDVIKHPGDILSGEVFDYYNYQLLGTVTIQDRNAYMIEFEQKKDVPFPLYKGYIFIDIETRAVIATEFSLSEIGIKKAADYMIIRKPPNLKGEVIMADYRVNYRYTGENWVLSYARSEAHFRVRWQKRLFRSNYFTVSEMAVTDVDTSQIIKFKFRETTKPADIFTDKVSYFSDPEFWGDYNIILPEQSIEEAIDKLNRRIKSEEESK